MRWITGKACVQKAASANPVLEHQPPARRPIHHHVFRDAQQTQPIQTENGTWCGGGPDWRLPGGL